MAVVLDLFSRKVIGWAMDLRMTSGLVCEALQMAIQMRHPDPGIVIHSDQGRVSTLRLSTSACFKETACWPA